MLRALSPNANPQELVAARDRVFYALDQDRDQTIDFHELHTAITQRQDFPWLRRAVVDSFFT